MGSFFKYLNIRQKITIPLALILTIVGLSIFYILFIRMENKIYDNAKIQTTNFSERFEVEINSICEKGLYLATPFASNPSVIKALKMPNKQGRIYLRNELNSYISNLKESTGLGENLRLHFHQPAAVSLWRIWKAEGKGAGGDELSGFRNSILEVYNSKKQVKGIEIGKGGLVLRGICPVFDDRDYIGSVESFFSFDDFLRKIHLGKNQSLGIFINKSAAEIAWKLVDNEKIGDYTIVDISDVNLKNLVTEEFINNGSSSFQFKVETDYALAAFPIKDFSGKNIAVAVVAEDLLEILNSEYTSYISLVIIIFFILGSVIVAIIFIIRNTLQTRIELVLDVADNLSSGNFISNAEISGNDELSTLVLSINKISEKWQQMIKSLQDAIVSIKESADEINNKAEELMVGTESQESVASETSASVSEMLNLIQNSAHHAVTTKSIAKSTQEVMELSRDKVDKTIEQMIFISEKIKILQSIASQTNILSLNASVEAARAGEYGKGFAVVASEVRRLAEQSQAASSEITEFSKESVSLAESTGETILSLNQKINETTDHINEINNAVNNQHKSAELINSALQGRNKATQKLTAFAQQLTQYSNLLENQAQSLEKIISFFDKNKVK